MFNSKSLVLATACQLIAAAPVLSETPASEETCIDRMPEVQALIDEMPDDASKALAEEKVKEAQQMFDSGRKRNCLLYIEALRQNIKTGTFSDG